MGYNKELIKSALNEIRTNGEKKRLLYERKKAEVLKENPRLAEIDREIMKLGPMLGISAMAGYKDRVQGIREKCKALSEEKEKILKKNKIEEYIPGCAKCKDTGYIGTSLCECVIKRAKEMSFAALSSQMPIMDCRFDNFSLDYYSGEDRVKMGKLFEFCKNYAENMNEKSESVMFMGGTGLGKTHLSLAIAGVALELGYGVIYSPAQNLISSLEKEHFSYDSKTSLLDDVMSCDLLILDDLGAEFSNSYSQSLIYNIINTRLLAKKPVIISTNLSLEDLAERYTPRVASRIFGCYTIKRFCGEDVRQKKRIEEIK